jgi:hypothetical protein
VSKHRLAKAALAAKVLPACTIPARRIRRKKQAFAVLWTAANLKMPLDKGAIVPQPDVQSKPCFATCTNNNAAAFSLLAGTSKDSLTVVKLLLHHLLAEQAIHACNAARC